MQLRVEHTVSGTPRSSLPIITTQPCAPRQVTSINRRTLSWPRHVAVQQRAGRIIRATQETDQSTATEVEDKLREAFEQAKEAEHDITAGRAEQEEAAEQRKKDQRFARAKDALSLKEQGHELTPTAGHEQGDRNAGESVEERTYKNASPSKAVRQRLLELEAKRSPQPEQVSRIINRRDPAPPMSHHYAAAAWWAVSAFASNGKMPGNLGYP